MGFIPESNSATVRIGVRWRVAAPTTLDGKPLPKISDGALVELVVPIWAVADEYDRIRLRSKRTLEMLPTEASVWLGLSRKAVNPASHKKFRQVKGGAAASYLLAEVVLLEPLFVLVDGSERAKLAECRCGILLMNAEARSLNHAFTLLSQAFETERRSHTGNVFRQGFAYQNGRWLCLDNLRLAKVMKALQEIPETNVPKS